MADVEGQMFLFPQPSQPPAPSALLAKPKRRGPDTRQASGPPAAAACTSQPAVSGIAFKKRRVRITDRPGVCTGCGEEPQQCLCK